MKLMVLLDAGKYQQCPHSSVAHILLPYGDSHARPATINRAYTTNN